MRTHSHPSDLQRPRRRAPAPLAFALALALAASSGCGGDDAAASGPPANLLLVTFDTTRADHLGCYGDSQAATPTLDGLARRGVLFEHCVSSAPITLPSHATILTGLQPFHHGVRNNGTHHLPPEIVTLAEALAERGFATGAVVSAFVLDSSFGLDQGFQSYDDDLSGGLPSTSGGHSETRADDTIERALRFLAARRGGRWFLWLHLFDPHADYAPPEPYASRFAASPYDGEIAFADAQLGRLLEALRARGELDATLVVATADHGESLGEHGEPTHGVFVYDATTRVPLILAHPSLARGARIDALVESADVTPTVLELLGVPARSASDGRSLAAAARSGKDELEARTAYSEAMLPYFNYGWSDLRALRDAGHLFVRAPRPELYELARDPRETQDRAAAVPEVAAKYAAQLAALLPDPEADCRTSDSALPSSGVRQQLASLGYTFDDSAAPQEGARPDPKDRISVLARQQEGEQLTRQGRMKEAEAVYRALVDENPRSVPLRDVLSELLARQGRDAEVLQLELGSLELPGARPLNFIRAAELERRAGVPGWERRLEGAKRCDPRSPLPWVREAVLVHLPGDPDGAVAAFRTALELDPRFAPAWAGLAFVEANRQNVAAARDAARHATEADPNLFEGWFYLGTMSAAAGEPREALRCFERARALQPTHVDTLLGLARLHLELGEREAARLELSRARTADAGQVQRSAAANPAVAQLLAALEGSDREGSD